MDTIAAPLEHASPQRRVDRLLAHYAESHRHPTNELIHVVAIPAIMLSIVGLLFAIHPWVAYAFVAVSLVYYALLRSPVFFVVMLAWTGVLLAAVHVLGSLVLPVSATVFVVGWIFQFNWPQDRRQETFLLRGPPIPVRRTAVRGRTGVEEAGNPALTGLRKKAIDPIRFIGNSRFSTPSNRVLI